MGTVLCDFHHFYGSYYMFILGGADKAEEAEIQSQLENTVKGPGSGMYPGMYILFLSISQCIYIYIYKYVALSCAQVCRLEHVLSVGVYVCYMC